MQSPSDSAFSSGGPSGVTTKAHSALGDGDDLEKFDDDQTDPLNQGQQASSQRASGYPPSYADQQGRGKCVLISGLIEGGPLFCEAVPCTIFGWS